MTASKSSRARNARAQANAARNRNGAPAKAGGTASTSTAKTSTAKTATAKTVTAVKTPAAVKANGSNGTARRSTGAGTNGAGTNGTGTNGAGRSEAGATRSGAVATRADLPERSGSRLQAVRDSLTGAGTQTRPAAPFWLQLVTWLVAMAGLGVSIYLTIAHFTETALAGCSESGLVNCTKVTTSPQSYVFGIPVAVLGLAFYLFAVAAMSPWAWRSRRREVHIVRLASTVVGIGFVLYLIYAELFIIGSICLYCTSVHVLTFVLFALTAFAAAAWGLDPARNDG